MKAKSIKGSSTEEIKIALEKSLSDNFKPTLAIVFISIKQDRKAVCDLLNYEGIEIFGATSCGEFTEEHESKGELVILLMDMPKDCFKIIYKEVNDDKIINVSRAIAEEALQVFTNPAVIICTTGLNLKEEYFDGESLSNGISQTLGVNKFFTGGMAGDDFMLKGSYVFTHQKETDYGILALVLDNDKIETNGMAITGWQPLGIARTVTKSKGNLLYTLDDKSALDMYFKYLGKGEKTNDRDFKIFDELGIHYPFIVKRKNGGTILRTPMKVNREENALEMDIEIEEGTKLWFSVPPDFDIADTIISEAKELKENNKIEAEALLIFSCAGRVNVLGPLTQNENNGLQKLFDAPLAGFYTYGEYGREKNHNNEFHSGACSWVTISEKKL